MAGRKSPKPARQPAQVQKLARPAGKPRNNPGPVQSSADLNEHTLARPGQQAGGVTTVGGSTPVPPKGPAQSSVRPGPSGLRDQSSAATGTSIFQKADAGNRRLGRRDRT